MDCTPNLALRYSDLDEAGELIRRTFSSWPPKLDSRLMAARANHGHEHDDEAVQDMVEGPVLDRLPLPANQRWRRNPAAKLHMVDGEAFLAGPDDAAIHHLNAVGTGLWNLLGKGINELEAVAVLHGAFPEIDRGIIERDVAGLFSALAAAGVIVPIDHDRRPRGSG